jgi:colicin import membrane protein
MLSNVIWPAGVSIALHGALLAFILMGWESSPQQIKPQTPQYIEAKLVELTPKAQAAAAKPEQVQKVDLTQQRREREQAEQRERERRVAEQERKKAEEARQREQERQRELERQAERERRAERERQQRQAELEKALQAERGMVLEEQYATEAQSYTQAIKRRIEDNWSRPTSARNNMQAVLEIQLVPTGRVVSVSVIKSSGNAAFDRSAEQAVRQVDVFPEVKDMPPEVFERYYRRFNLLFNPQDLRQ